MGSPKARRVGQPHLGAILNEKGTGQDEEAPSMKYLEAWFETGWGWGKQLGELRKKNQEMTKRVGETKVPAEVAVYAVNTKIIPTLAYCQSLLTLRPYRLTRYWQYLYGSDDVPYGLVNP